jgi:hypothetical protein
LRLCSAACCGNGNQIHRFGVTLAANLKMALTTIACQLDFELHI